MQTATSLAYCRGHNGNFCDIFSSIIAMRLNVAELTGWFPTESLVLDDKGPKRWSNT